MAVKKKAAKKVVKKAAAKKVVKKATVKKAAKKAPAKKAAPKKAVAKKAAPKKAVAKKAAPKKAVAKKAAPKKTVAKKAAPKKAVAKKPASVAFMEMAKIEVLEMVTEPKKSPAKKAPVKKDEPKKAVLPASASAPAKKEGQVSLDENEFIHLKMAKAKHENPRDSHLEEEEAPEVEHPPLTPIVRETPKVGRNEPCPCGSGLKYKKCHGKIA